MGKSKHVGVRTMCVCLLLAGISSLLRIAYAASDTMPPTVTFGTNGASNVPQAVTTVVVSDTGSGVNSNSLQYVWDTQNGTAPGSGWTSFTNGTALVQGSVTGTFYLWVTGTDNAGNTVTAVSNAFIIVSNVTVTKDTLTRAYIVTPTGSGSTMDMIDRVVLAARNDGYALVIEHPVASMTIPAAVVKNDLAMNVTDTLSLSIEHAQSPDIPNKIKATDASIVSAGNLCKFEMNIVSGGSASPPVTTFSRPLKITIKDAMGYVVPAKTSVFNVIPSYDVSGTLQSVTSIYVLCHIMIPTSPEKPATF